MAGPNNSAMKFARVALLMLALAGPLAAQDPARPPAAAKPSARLKEEIRAALPAFAPPTPKAPGELAPPEGDPHVLALPKVTVREKRSPRIVPDELLTERELNKKLAAEYRGSLKGLDALLNRFTIPILSPSAAERGRALRDQRTLEDARRLADLGRQADAENAAALDADLAKTGKDMAWRNRAAGEGRAK
jgi:hypothetical protein